MGAEGEDVVARACYHVAGAEDATKDREAGAVDPEPDSRTKAREPTTATKGEANDVRKRGCLTGFQDVTRALDDEKIHPTAGRGGRKSGTTNGEKGNTRATAGPGERRWLTVSEGTKQGQPEGGQNSELQWEPGAAKMGEGQRRGGVDGGPWPNRWDRDHYKGGDIG